MTALLVRSVSRVARPFAAMLLILMAFQLALIAVAASLSASDDFERLARLVPAALQAAVAPALTSFARMTTIGYFDALIVIAVVQWAIYVATEPAGEIESGLVDLVLARPLPRHRLVTRSLIVMTGSTLTLTMAMLMGTLLGLTLFAPRGATWPEPRLLALIVAHLTMVAWCFGAAALAATGWARRRASAVASVAIGAGALYLVDLLGLWWRPFEAIAHVSPFYYFHGGAIVAGKADATLDLTVLIGATVTLTGLAYWRFAQRDL